MSQLSDFLAKHCASKKTDKNNDTHDDKTETGPTHTRIPDRTLNIYGGAFIIPSEELPVFYKLYYNEIFVKKKMEYLKEIARSAADEVAINKTEKELPPMPPYERRIIHMEIAERTDVKTESVGEEPERRIVISPK